MDTSTFDPSTYLDATLEEPSLRRPPLTAGMDFVGTIGEVKSRAWQKDGRGGIIWDVPIKIDVGSRPEEAQRVGVKEVTLSDSVFVDLNETGAIDNGVGKNGKLRRYREALDLNKPGDRFNARIMTGRLIRVKIKHRIHEGETYDDVDSVAKA